MRLKKFFIVLLIIFSILIIVDTRFKIVNASTQHEIALPDLIVPATGIFGIPKSMSVTFEDKNGNPITASITLLVSVDRSCAKDGEYYYYSPIFRGEDTYQVHKKVIWQCPGHSWGGWTITKEATCVSKGTKYRQCSVCGEKEYQDIPITSNHDFKNGVCSRCNMIKNRQCPQCNSAAYQYIKGATCTNDGKKYKYCKNIECGIQWDKETIPKLGHIPGAVLSRTAATCTRPGSIELSCERCNKTYSETIPKLDHNYKDTVTKPTCTEQGYATHKCTRCGRTYTDSYTNALGHSYVNGICTKCGASDPNPGSGSETHVHTWQAATCERPKTCSGCGATQGTVINHNFKNNVCTMCDKTRCEINGHQFDDNNICTVCGFDNGNGNDVHEHNFVNGVCSICGQLETAGILNKWKLGENVEGWLHEGGTLEIKGTGAMYDFVGDTKNPITKKSRIKKVEVTGEITTIGAYSFYYFSFTNITFSNPDLITKIGDGAFFGCRVLKSFTMPKNVTLIGARAFCHCHDLTKMDLSNCSGLTLISHEAFRDCWLLRDVKLPEGLKVIGYEAFFNCLSLKDVILPSTLRALGTIGELDTEEGIGLEGQIEDPHSKNTSGYNYVFGIDFTRNTGTETLTSYFNIILGQNGIIDVENGRSITIDEDTMQITGLTPEETTLLQKFMSKIRVWYYYPDQFVPSGYSLGLIDAYLESAKERTGEVELVISATKWDISESSEDNVIATLDKNGKFKIEGTGKVKDYELNGTPWNAIKNKIKSLEVKEGVTTLGSHMFYYSSLKTVTLPSTLKEIHRGVFFGCRKIKNITLPDNLEVLAEYAFCHAEDLETITLPKNITRLNGGTFRDCYKLTEVKANGEIIEIGERDFYNNPSLEAFFTISPNLESIGAEAFAVDFSGDSYTNATAYKESYNEGDYKQLTINYYEDCEPIITYISSNTNTKRAFNKIKIDSISVKEGYQNDYIEGEELNTINITLIIKYKDNTTREIKGDNEKVSYGTTTISLLDENLHEGENNIPVTYNGHNTSITINISHNWNPEEGICSICGKECTHLPKLVETVAPTCEEQGLNKYTCTICGYTYTEVTNELGHEYITKVVEPTCTEKGYTEHKCERCNDIYYTDETEKLSHSYTSTVVKEATCLEKGERKFTCSRCNYTYSETIEALGHDWIIEVMEPTCTENGYTKYTCTRCAKTYSDSITQKIEHQYIDGKCIMCGKEEPTIESSVYTVSTEISHIQPKTTLENFSKNIKTNGTIIIKDADNKEISKDAKISTGMKAEVSNKGEQKEYTLIVLGDVDGDGNADFWDMLAINKHRLKIKELNEIQQQAGDVSIDGNADFWDMLRINKYRLGLISSL